MTNLKNLSIYILVIVVGVAIAAFIIPAFIKLFFAVLLGMFNHPAIALGISVAFLIGCFTGSIEFSKKLLSLGAFFSASGIITFNNSTSLKETFKTIPDDRILIETDSPYLAPVPMRGKRNEPSFLQHTAKELSIIKEKTIEEIDDLTTQNFNHLFNVV